MHIPKTEARCCVFTNNLSVYVFALQSIYLSSKDETSDDGFAGICPTRPLFAYLESHRLHIPTQS